MINEPQIINEALSETHEQLAAADRPSEDGLLEIDISGLPAGELVKWLEDMVLIREFEEALEPLTLSGKIPGSVHQASGQEAVAVGVVRALRPGDIVASPHRPHHHALAKGLTPRAVMAELWGRATGCAGGRGGTMHLIDFSLGYFGSNGIVGAALGIAMGAALAAKLRQNGQVCVGFFGDGGANTGRTWEFVNFATVEKLPLIVVCENNQYAVETWIRREMVGGTIAERAIGFGLPASQVDGQDIAAVYAATVEARERAAAGGGPTFIEAVTYRYRGHNTGEVINYRTEDEVEHWRATRDPVERLRSSLERLGQLRPGQFEEIVAGASAVVQDSIEFSESSPVPDPATAGDRVLVTPFDEKGLA